MTALTPLRRTSCRMSRTGVTPAFLFLFGVCGFPAPVAGYGYNYGYNTYYDVEPPSPPPLPPHLPGACVGDFTSNSPDVQLCSAITGDMTVQCCDA
jgi:hypothetical protein